VTGAESLFFMVHLDREPAHDRSKLSRVQECGQGFVHGVDIFCDELEGDEDFGIALVAFMLGVEHGAGDFDGQLSA